MIDALPDPCWEGVLAHANAMSVVAMRQTSRCCRSRTVGELGGRVVLGVFANKTEVRDIGTWRLQSKLDAAGVCSCRFSPDGKRVMTMGDSVAKVWDVESGDLVWATRGGDCNGANCCFSPDGNRVAIGGWENVIVLNADNGEEQLKLPADGFLANTACCFSPKGDSIATFSLDCSAVIWDLPSGKERIKIGDEELGARADLSFSSDGSRLATAATDPQSTRVWCTQTGIVLFALNACYSSRTCIFSPSLRNYRLLTVGRDRTIRVWDTRTATTQPRVPLVTIPRAHTEQYIRCAFSKDSKLIISCSSDGMVRAWDAATGNLIGSPLTLRSAAADCDCVSRV